MSSVASMLAGAEILEAESMRALSYAMEKNRTPSGRPKGAREGGADESAANRQVAVQPAAATARFAITPMRCAR